MRAFSILTRNAGATKALGAAIGRMLSGGEMILLSGPLGAGKTTFVQGMAAGLDVMGPVQSPSFVLERIHRGRLTLRHLDFYRLGAQEVEDAGFLDEPDDSAVTVIEWAERAEALPEAALWIRIDPLPGEPDGRSILVETESAEWGEKIEDVTHSGH